MMTPPELDLDAEPDVTDQSVVRRLIGRISRLEMMVAAVVAAVLLVLVVIEPEILEAPFENANTLLFTFGGTALAALAFVAMLWFKVPAAVRITVLVVPFVFVNWWLLSPYFIDEVVDEQFSTSISEQIATVDDAPAAADAPVGTAAPAVEAPADDAGDAIADPPAAPEAEETPAVDEAPAAAPAEQAVVAAPPAEEPPAPSGPELLGAGSFVGLAGHDGVGDAGIFRNPDGSFTLRFENFDIDNGPDLEVYLVPGADQVDLAEGSIHLGALKGNVGDQNYEFAADLPPGTYTALVWCEAFSVEFVGATITI